MQLRNKRGKASVMLEKREQLASVADQMLEK